MWQGDGGVVVVVVVWMKNYDKWRDHMNDDKWYVLYWQDERKKEKSEVDHTAWQSVVVEMTFKQWQM